MSRPASSQLFLADPADGGLSGSQASFATVTHSGVAALVASCGPSPTRPSLTPAARDDCFEGIDILWRDKRQREAQSGRSVGEVS